jgi:hypothetical protein
MQKVGIYAIFFTDSFYDGLIKLNKFFSITGAVIMINVACLELGWPPNLPEWCCQSAEPTSPCWGDVSC